MSYRNELESTQPADDRGDITNLSWAKSNPFPKALLSISRLDMQHYIWSRRLEPRRPSNCLDLIHTAV